MISCGFSNHHFHYRIYGHSVGLGILWVTKSNYHRSKNSEDKDPFSVVGVLRRIDITSVLFSTSVSC
jgi:hypothetical protein